MGMSMKRLHYDFNPETREWKEDKDKAVDVKWDNAKKKYLVKNAKTGQFEERTWFK